MKKVSCTGLFLKLTKGPIKDLPLYLRQGFDQFKQTGLKMKPELIIEPDGTKYWYLNGVLHRTDGPALEWSSGTKSWYLNGKLHRTDGPAIEGSKGSKMWYLNGVLHRIDGPAVESSNGYKAWYLNGLLHRTDAPAIEHSNGAKEWYLNGKELSEDLFLKLTGPIKELPLYLELGHDQFIADRIKNET